MSKATAAEVTVSQPNSPCATAIALREKAKFYSASVIIPDDKVTLAFIQDILAKFKIEAKIDDEGDQHVPEAFGPTLYIRLHPSRHWVIFITRFDTSTLDSEDSLMLANHLNRELAMGQFAVSGRGIGASYYFYYRGGLNIGQFMEMAQRFGSLMFSAMKEYATFNDNFEHQDRERPETVVLN